MARGYLGYYVWTANSYRSMRLQASHIRRFVRDALNEEVDLDFAIRGRKRAWDDRYSSYPRIGYDHYGYGFYKRVKWESGSAPRQITNGDHAAYGNNERYGGRSQYSGQYSNGTAPYSSNDYRDPHANHPYSLVGSTGCGSDHTTEVKAQELIVEMTAVRTQRRDVEALLGRVLLRPSTSLVASAPHTIHMQDRVQYLYHTASWALHVIDTVLRGDII